jgi:hypothetical protein
MRPYILAGWFATLAYDVIATIAFLSDFLDRIYPMGWGHSDETRQVGVKMLVSGALFTVMFLVLLKIYRKEE